MAIRTTFKIVSLEQRRVIERGIRDGKGMKAIGDMLGVTDSSVRGEIERNSASDGNYTAHHAQMKFERRHAPAEPEPYWMPCDACHGMGWRSVYVNVQKRPLEVSCNICGGVGRVLKTVGEVPK